jgi:RNA polymerase sigma-70 factor (ECF subfamily)
MQPDATPRLVDRARLGDEGALAELFRIHEPRLVRMVELRLDARLRSRLDAADVVQEAWLEVVRRLPSWSGEDELPFLVWVRLIAAQALAQARRRHLGAGMRDAQREVALGAERSGVSTVAAAEAFVASATSPTQAARREELRAGVLAALEELDELDREIVVLRHFEGLSNEEAALELAITPAAASKRFVRALVRLRPILEALALEPRSEGA